MGTAVAAFPEVSRRGFLTGVAGLAGAGALAACTPAPQPYVPNGNLFTLGVASGDPLPNSVVLWTRLAQDPLAGGGMPHQDIRVDWEVATDPSFTTVVRAGWVAATPALGHSVHVDPMGLSPATDYWYRFSSSGQTSPVGRTRTAPAAGAAVSQVRFATASCQNYGAGHYVAYDHMVGENLDFVIFLGDYIYESSSGSVRTDPSANPTDLVGYRNRYAAYKLDSKLQAAHARYPWIVTWDDHEVHDNYAGGADAGASDLARRAGAYQAFYEHLPVRSPAPSGPAMNLYRGLAWGSLADIHVLDLRQYRTDQPCGGIEDIAWDCADAHSTNGTILGAAQRTWLTDRLASSTARWNLFANSVIITPGPFPLGLWNHDQWDGYWADRTTVLGTLSTRGVSGPVFLTGDVHSHVVGNVSTDVNAPIVATEFVTSSITSSSFLTGLTGASTTGGRVLWVDDTKRGYVVCTATPSEMVADYRSVDSVSSTSSAISTVRRFRVSPTTPGAIQVA